MQVPHRGSDPELSGQAHDGFHGDAAAEAAERQAEKEESGDPRERARTICLNQLSYCARTRAHLESVLLKRGIPTEIAAEVLDRFTELGLINDAEYARTYAQSRQRSRGLSARSIQRELQTKGVSTEDISEAMVDVDDESQRRIAQTLVERKLRGLAGVETQVATRRLVGMLARKGYSPSLAYAVVREVLGAAAVEADDGPPPD
ncbi:MAG: Regulatory protein RecX [Actinomycetota bacterium]